MNSKREKQKAEECNAFFWSAMKAKEKNTPDRVV
jgi:hypothetical protein